MSQSRPGHKGLSPSLPLSLASGRQAGLEWNLQWVVRVLSGAGLRRCIVRGRAWQDLDETRTGFPLWPPKVGRLPKAATVCANSYSEGGTEHVSLGGSVGSQVLLGFLELKARGISPKFTAVLFVYAEEGKCIIFGGTPYHRIRWRTTSVFVPENGSLRGALDRVVQ